LKLNTIDSRIVVTQPNEDNLITIDNDEEKDSMSSESDSSNMSGQETLTNMIKKINDILFNGKIKVN